MTGYVYDADGDRVGKGTIPTTFSCNSSNGLAITSGYVVGLSGEQLTETNGGTGWLHTHVFANGQLLATYSSTDTLFELTDWLGTRRADVGASGCKTTWQSLPYGDGLISGPNSNCSDSSELHFTGKERDPESGNDYFMARYYAGSMGRFLSPDPSGLGYADITNPQSLNLYSYVENNPLIFTDPSGLDCVYDNGNGTVNAVEGDCNSPKDDGYYIDCNGCVYNAAGATLDLPTGTLTFTDENGNVISDENGNDAAISGFADPQGVTTNVTVNGSGEGIDVSTGYGYDGYIGVTHFNNLPFIPGLVVSNPNGPTGPPRSFWGTIKAMGNCWATGDPDHHIGPKSSQPGASSDSIPNKAADLSVTSRSGKTMSPNVGNPEAAERMGKGGDAAAMFTDISHCVYGR